MRCFGLSLLLFFITNTGFAADVHYEIVSGQEVSPYIDDLANLRMNVFAEYPYLYEGKLEYERPYLNQYVVSQNSIIALAKIDSRVIGFVSGVPIAESFDQDSKNLFSGKEISVETIFYLGEIVIEPEYRYGSIGNKLYELFERQVRSSGAYTTIMGCMVVRDEDDPKRPSNYVALDKIIEKRGAVKCPDLIERRDWPESGQEDFIPHLMQYWAKEL
jgi:ribosomal protein S18 acetylase RimI-like enzyme